MMRIWWVASRSSSLPKIVLPIAVGLSLGYAQNGIFRPGLAVLALLFGWFDQLMIIFFNDFADADADTWHTTRYPHLIDPRAIPNGWLTREAIFAAGVLSAVGMIAVAAVAMGIFSRPWMPLFAVMALLMMWAYSFKPFRLNYRGAGEVLEAAGVGGVLPWLGFYLHTGSLAVPVWVLLPILGLAFASALSSGIKHLPADLETGKRTAAVLLGTPTVRILILACLWASVLVCIVYIISGRLHPSTAVLTVVMPMWFSRALWQHGRCADHRHLVPLKRFKVALHRAIYAINLGIITNFLVL